jgi:thioredoxin reductase
MAKRLIVIGAGPMGLEAALLAHEAGFEVTVLEKGRIGDALFKWSTTRFFSPFGMNVSERTKRVLRNDAPKDDTLMSGEEHARVLVRLAERAPLEGTIMTGHRVIAVGRARMTRTEMPSHPVRAERAFRVIAEKDGQEVAFEADAVLDASGVYDQPLSTGAGGLWAHGERKLGPRIIRQLGQLDSALPKLEGKRVLLVGHGHSAANALARLMSAGPARLTWAVRTPNKRPCVEIADDPLSERRDVVARANQLAEAPPSTLSIERRAHVESIEAERDGLLVKMTGDRSVNVDEIVSLTGYRPDLSFLSELSIEISPVSEGADRLHRALAHVADCLSVPKLGPKDLASGEPGFHLVGIKSYGRLPTFLLKNGIAQLESMIAALRSRE